MTNRVCTIIKYKHENVIERGFRAPGANSLLLSSMNNSRDVYCRGSLYYAILSGRFFELILCSESLFVDRLRQYNGMASTMD